MKFLSIFLLCFLLILILISVFGALLENVWLLIAAVAFLIALFVRVLISFDERLERIERHLGLHTDSQSSFAEQIESDKENAP